MVNKNDKYIQLLKQYEDIVKNIPPDYGFQANNQELSFLINNQVEYSKDNIDKLQELSLYTLNLFEKKSNEIIIEKNEITKKLTEINNYGITSSSELINFVRNLTQKKQSTFEYLFNETTNKFCKPVIGSFWEDINLLIEKFNEKSFQKKKRSSSVQLSVNKEFTDALFENVKVLSEKYAFSTIEILTNHIEVTKNDIKNFFNSKNIINFNFTEKDISQLLKTEDIMKSVLRIDSPFQGSYSKANFRNVIMQVRSYSIMLVMILTMFGLNSQIHKPENANIANVFYISSVALILLGIQLTWVKMQDTKSEQIEDEIKKAKEKLSIEVKRIVTEFVNEWRNLMLSNFKHIMSDIISDVDYFVKKIDAEKLSYNQQLQMLNVKEQIILKNSKMIESQLTQIDLLLKDAEKEFNT